MVSCPVGTHEHKFVLSETLTCFETGLLFDEKKRLTTAGHSRSPGVGGGGE
jgi:hypothetical protein